MIRTSRFKGWPGPILTMDKIEYDGLVQLLQEKKIGHLHFVLESDNEQDFLKWGEEHSVEPSDDAAEFYIEQNEISAMDRQVIDDEEYGIWN